jgi:hypothetical protein
MTDFGISEKYHDSVVHIITGFCYEDSGNVHVANCSCGEGFTIDDHTRIYPISEVDPNKICHKCQHGTLDTVHDLLVDIKACQYDDDGDLRGWRDIGHRVSHLSDRIDSTLKLKRNNR